MVGVRVLRSNNELYRGVQKGRICWGKRLVLVLVPNKLKNCQLTLLNGFSKISVCQLLS